MNTIQTEFKAVSMHFKSKGIDKEQDTKKALLEYVIIFCNILEIKALYNIIKWLKHLFTTPCKHI